MNLSPIQQHRFFLICLTVGCIAVAITLLLFALRSHITYFYTPSESIPPHTIVRLGGIVKEGSVHISTDKQRPLYQFTVTDTQKEVCVTYNGLLPDLFREGQGVVVEGQLSPTGTFMATKVLAKHDETYMPPEVANALKKKGLWRVKDKKASEK